MKIFALCFIALLVLAGCRSPEPARPVYAGEARVDTFTGVGVNIEGRLNEDGTLDPVPFVGELLPNQQVLIVGARAVNGPNGIPRLQFTLESRRDKPNTFQYRFTWMDRDGFVVQPDQNPWQTLHLAGREVAAIESVAQSSQAKAFRLMIRPLEFKK